VQQEQPEMCGPDSSIELYKAVVYEPAGASDQPSKVGLKAVHCRVADASDVELSPLLYHWLVLFVQPPEELTLLYDGVKRHVPPPSGAISLVPAGNPSRWRCRGPRELLHIFLAPELVGRVANEAFDLDPTRLTLPPLDGMDLPQLRAAMEAVDAELTAAGAGGTLAAESLANVLAVQLLRHILAPRQEERGSDGALPQLQLRAVLDYIEEHLDVSPNLEQLAAITHRSPYHFSRQFKAATGLPPHQYVILRRVERAKQLLRAGGDLSLAEIAQRAGFSDQSQFSRHFKRIVGVTPRQFRI
jgi:AraC family transcriptional regulator